MPRGGRLTIVATNADVGQGSAADPARPFVRLVVGDTGTGMDEATRRRIYEPFFTPKARGKGTGRGLSVVASSIEQSGGTISITCTPGAGTSFELLLPRADAAAPASVVSGSLESRETVLLVDDSQSVRAYGRLILEEEGYLVLEADDGVEALEVAAAHDGPIHILTNRSLPGVGIHGRAGRRRRAFGPRPV